jgi:hypothetical protein
MNKEQGIMSNERMFNAQYTMFNVQGEEADFVSLGRFPLVGCSAPFIPFFMSQ